MPFFLYGIWFVSFWLIEKMKYKKKIIRISCVLFYAAVIVAAVVVPFVTYSRTQSDNVSLCAICSKQFHMCRHRDNDKRRCVHYLRLICIRHCFISIWKRFRVCECVCVRVFVSICHANTHTHRQMRIHIHFNKNGNIEINENERISVFMYVLHGNTQPTTIYRSLKPIYFFSCDFFFPSLLFIAKTAKMCKTTNKNIL